LTSLESRSGTAQRRRAALCLLILGCAIAATLTALSVLGGSRASAQVAPGEPTPQTDDSVPASQVTMIGASPNEAPGETWGIGQSGADSGVLVRYARGTGWSLGPQLLSSSGQPLVGFTPDQPRSGLTSPLAGQMTASGSGVLVGTVPDATAPHGDREVLLARNPGGSFEEVPAVPHEGEAALIEPTQSLFATVGRAPLLTPLDEGGGKAGALIVPVGGLIEDAVLHWDGSAWTSEPIEVPAASSSEFHVVAIGASALSNAWLVGELSSGGLALFRRHPGSGSEAPSWRAVAPAPGFEPGEPLTVPVEGEAAKPFAVAGAPNVATQVLTVTGEGVWLDGEREDTRASTTMYFQPQGETGAAAVTSWCTQSTGAKPCNHELPEPLSNNTMRSIAWANPATPYGERVITGFTEGITLRLDGTSFTRVLGLGASLAPNDTGGTYGAAFSSAREGWLGQSGLPVHLTLEPSPSRLAPWPVSFRHALLAVAPQPGATAGALSSEALAVGDRGEVARYKPGMGWMPESLLNASGRPVKPAPVLRAVAWPEASRAYAVGNEGQMWLWRSETGLWEQDPATPFNFRGNLLGIAFDPNEPNRGYAVGQSGVLLGYGKSWAQEPLPPQVANASFTSIAFAGNEAIVAYRELPNTTKNQYVGGLLVNDGSGWRIDTEAAAAIGANVPEVVAGLPDGGAAFAASGSGPAMVFERNGASSPWQATSTPLPGGRQPGSLALFREGGALRAIASGSALDTFDVESVAPAPPGFPPTLIKPYPLTTNSESGVLRQTATGWNDEEHELSNVREGPGHYRFWDMPYQPDPVAAVLIDPTGRQGWAVGGFVEANHEDLDTADIDRYPADGVTPPGVGGATVSTGNAAANPVASFAIAGGAQCGAPCADRANADIGPDTWLSSALARVAQIPETRDFFYTGPRVTSGETAGPPTLQIPYARELNRYASLLAASQLSTFAAASPSDLAGGAGESLFDQVFSGFPAPFGARAAECAEQLALGAACQPYYAFDSGTSAATTVRVIVLDDSSDVDATQQSWLGGELAGRAKGEPAIVLGNANLNTQIAAGDPSAIAVAAILQRGGASAYFYDSPEENRHAPLTGAPSVETFGSGTLGYVNSLGESRGDFLGASGFLLAQVHFKEPKPNSPDRVNVTARLIPNIGELGLEAQDGTLLRRSQTAFFAGLARRPRAGNRSPNGQVAPETDPYIPLPSICIGTRCNTGLLPEYTFSSSRPDIGNFVKQNTAAAGAEPTVLLENEKPVPDPTSGLFCAYNAGTTIVTISAGGYSSSLPITVQPGSVRRPCGTTLLNEPSVQQSAEAPVAPAPAPAPAGPAPAASSPPPVPVPAPPPVPTPAAPQPPPAAKPPAFFLPLTLNAPVLAFVPPPVPTPARPTPPSGTSAVTSPVEAAEKEEEHEEATEQVSNQAVAYRAEDHEPTSAYLLGVIALAALAGVGVVRRPRRRRRDAQLATVSISSRRTQERGSSRPRRRW
jgi:hypothetical protein